MLTQLRTSPTALLLPLVLCLAGCASFDDIDTWPLLSTEPEQEFLPGRVEALGPFVDVQWQQSTTQWGLKPLFSVRNYRDVPYDRIAQFDVPFFAAAATLSTLARRTPPRTDPGEGRRARQVLALYPLYRHESCEPLSRTIFIPLYYNVRNRHADQGWYHHWALFPIYFGGNSRAHGPYHAVFPLGGVCKNLFGRDKVRFVLGPLYIHASSGGRESYNVLWPFFNYTAGGGRDRWYVWPLIGRMKRQDNPPRWFFLWPFFWHTPKPKEGERETRGSAFFPFWGWQKDGAVYRRNVIWPLFSYARNEKTGRTDYVTPWPILRIGDGPDYYRRQAWPFYGYLDDAHVHRHYVLWPLYRREVRETDRSRMRGRSVLIIYRSITNEWKGSKDEDRSDYENILWPLYYYKRDGLGNKVFTTLNIRGVPDPQGWDRFYTFIWRIYEYESRAVAPGTLDTPWKSTRALWGAYRYDRGWERSRMRVFPLFTSRRADGRLSGLEVLMGLFGYIDKPGARTYRLLFIPWTVKREGER